MGLIGSIWDEIERPSDAAPGPLTSAYQAGLGAIGHGVLGAAAVALIGAWGLLAGLAVAAGYWLWKERADLKRGGGLLDGLEDAAMVWLGAWYGAAWWPALMLVCGALVMASRAVRVAR